MTQQSVGFLRKAIEKSASTSALCAGGAMALSLWQLPVALILPIFAVWFLAIISLHFLHQVPEGNPRGANIAMVLLVSSVLLITTLSLAVSLFRNPDAVKKIEAELSVAIKDTAAAQGHSIDCKDCPDHFKSVSPTVLLTSAPVLTERKTIPLAQFVVDASSSKNVLVFFWVLAVLYFVISVFIAFGSYIAALSLTVSTASSISLHPPASKRRKK
jgi:hypothetical protein